MEIGHVVDVDTRYRLNASNSTDNFINDENVAEAFEYFYRKLHHVRSAFTQSARSFPFAVLGCIMNLCRHYLYTR